MGVFWVGAVLFIAAFLVPSVRAAGPAGGAIMRQLVEVRKLPLWLMGASVLTILSGIGLYWVDSAGFQSAWLGSGPGRTFGLGGVLALAAAVLGMAVNAPTARRTGSGGREHSGRASAAHARGGRADRAAADSAQPGDARRRGAPVARHTGHGGRALRALRPAALER